MPPRVLTAQSVVLSELHVNDLGDSYRVRVEYVVQFDDGSAQSQGIERLIETGALKTALDNIMGDIKTRISNREGIPVT